MKLDEKLDEITAFAYNKMYFEMASAKWWPSFLRLRVLLVGGLGRQPYTTRLVQQPAIYTATQSEAFGRGVVVGLIVRV